ncbi:MAG: hypothetical protein RLZZ341_1305, partial [Pseudomonadota bacterium]
MPEPLIWAALALLALNLALLLALLLRRPPDSAGPQLERLERELRDELGRQGQGTRGDLASFQQMLLTASGDAVRTQNEQIDGFRVQLGQMQQALDAALRRFADSQAEQLHKLSEANERRIAEVRQAVEQR